IPINANLADGSVGTTRLHACDVRFGIGDRRHRARSLLSHYCRSNPCAPRIPSPEILDSSVLVPLDCVGRTSVRFMSRISSGLFKNSSDEESIISTSLFFENLSGCLYPQLLALL